jgi:hypothetical protein
MASGGENAAVGIGMPRRRPRWRGCCQVNASRAICKREGARSGGACQVEARTTRSTLPDGNRPTVHRPRRKPQAPSVSLGDQNRAAELRFAADKGPRKVELTVSA